jgi:hypothetical protein
MSNILRRFHEQIRSATALATVAAVFTLGLAIAAPAFASGVQLNATLQPSEISLGEAAQLDITLQGAQPGRPQVPQVDGLTFTPIGQSSTSESINGVTSESVSLTYRVTAAQPGRYAIPAIEFQGARTTALSLDVRPAQAGGPGAAASPGRPLPPPAVGAGTTPSRADFDHQSTGRTAFVQLIVPKTKLYVGELMPVEIKAYFRSDLGVNLEGPPTLQSDAFTVSNLTGNPQQSQERIGGVPYTTLSWYSAIVPIKNGDYPLALQLPVTLKLHEALDSSSQMPDLAALLGNAGLDSFFDDANLQSLLGREVDQSVTLKAPATNIAVSSLPTAGQPSGFSGAVGSFQIQTRASPSHVAAGDPVTVTWNIQGAGNFDRVNSAGIPTDATWKAYRPQATFSPEDSVGREGDKQFEQTVVPMRAGHLALPGIEFSYFDPKSGQYVVRHTQPLEVSVTPGSTPVSTPSAIAQASTRAPSREESQAMQLAPLMPTMGPRTASLSPMVQRAWFFALPGAPLAVMAGGLLLLARRERPVSGPAHAAAATAAQVSAALACMDEALQSGDGAAFITAAQRALQVRLGHCWGMAPHEVTRSQVDARLDSSWDPIRQVFALAEQSAYAGWHPHLSTLSQWRQIVQEQLHRAEQL